MRTSRSRTSPRTRRAPGGAARRAVRSSAMTGRAVEDRAGAAHGDAHRVEALGVAARAACPDRAPRSRAVARAGRRGAPRPRPALTRAAPPRARTARKRLRDLGAALSSRLAQRARDEVECCGIPAARAQSDLDEALAHAARVHDRDLVERHLRPRSVAHDTLAGAPGPQLGDLPDGPRRRCARSSFANIESGTCAAPPGSSSSSRNPSDGSLSCQTLRRALSAAAA